MTGQNQAHTYVITSPSADGQSGPIFEVEADEIITRRKSLGLEVRLWLKGEKVAEVYPAAGWFIRDDG
ncbi:MAG: hypothetical protein OXD50_08540 [Chloroflexi bacterium]|nr:hypothetical protein [Chloroflexota bacterium]